MADAETRTTPFDPSAERIARVYAQAILEAADAASCRGEVLEEFDSFVRDVLPGVPNAAAVFASPKIGPEHKEGVIQRVVGGRLRPTTVHALCVLARHGRLGIVAEVSAALRSLDNELAGRRQATFTTAVSLPVEDQQRIVTEVAHAVGATLAPSFVVDPDIIGGLVVRIGDTVYDQSIASGLARLAGNLQRRTIHEIQYGRDRLASA